MTSTDLGVAVFDGPGPVRGLLREMDWSATPVGPVVSWSPVLRTMVGVCLSAGFPMVIHWGPALVAIYNDRFAALIGGKHPAALGRAARDTWPEVWDRVGTRMARVTTDGHTLQADDEQQIMHRNGYPEECYFSYSHSPITDIDGAIAGMFTVTTETTSKVLYERRMRVVRQLGALSVADTVSTVDTCRAALRVLQTVRETMPFAVAYLTGEDGVPRRVAEYGLVPDTGVPGVIDGHTGVIARVIGLGRVEELTGLRTGCPGAFLPGPLGPLVPDQAVTMPLTVSGRADPVGALLVGVNPYRPLDEDYRGFFALIGRQFRVALTDTLAYESERHRVAVLADLDRTKMEFFQNISHELRTPLTLLLAPLHDLLTAAGTDPGPAREDLRSAVTAAERLSGMVDALLDFSGAEAGTLAPDRQPTDVAGATAEVASMFRSTAEHAGLRFAVQIPDTPVTALLDRAMWSTIVTNLLSNAVKYTLHGGIDLRLRATETEVELTVTDTGPGIEPEEQARVFDRFYRAQDGQPDRGAGIGLALVADLIRAHHGHVGLHSTPGQGSTFTVHIPLGDPVTEDQPETQPPTTQRGPRVLLVEDDADLRAYLTRLLTRDGWAVQAVPDAETALTTTGDPTRPAPDLVLTDLILPGHSGLHLVAALRGQPRTARLPVIILTARGGPDAAAEGLAAGADDYITKPFSSRELLARVQANHELHQQREQAIDAAQGREQQIRGALDSNRTIGTAIGIVMASYQLTARQGFQLLVTASQNTNNKLRDIAARVVDTGALPFRPTVIDDLIIRIAQHDT